MSISGIAPPRDHAELRERYAAQFGVAAGYLPSSLDGLGAWLERVAREVAAEKCPRHPAVEEMRQLIADDRQVRGLVTAMIAEAHGLTRSRQHPIDSPEQMLDILDCIISKAPTPQNAFPVSGLFLYMMFTEAGWYAFRNARFNASIRTVLRAYEEYLDSRASLDVIHSGPDGWLSPAAQRKMDLKDYQVDWDDPHGGFESYNAFFHRNIKDHVRQLAGPDQPDVIVSANDGVVFRIAHFAQLDAPFWTKDQPYSLRHILGEKWAPEFVDGDVFQTFLAGSNFHRWVAPIGGEIVESTVIPGLMFSELLSVGWDPGGGTKSTAYEASVNTRGLVIIDSGDGAIGMVAVVPIGITEVSSVRNVYGSGDPVCVGDQVEKGDEIGRFSLGGSTLALIFQPAAIKEWRFSWPPECPACPPAVSVRDWIAIAN